MISESIQKYFFLSTESGDGNSRKESLQRALERAGLANPDMHLHSRSMLVKDTCVYHGKGQRIFAQPLAVCFVSITSNLPGQTISASIGAGIPDQDNSPIIVESHSGLCSEDEAALELERLIKRSSLELNINLRQILVKATQHRVITCGAVVAFCPFFRKGM